MMFLSPALNNPKVIVNNLHNFRDRLGRFLMVVAWIYIHLCNRCYR